MNRFTTAIDGFSIRAAEREDIPLILTFIKSLAEYENMLSEVVATEEILEEWLFQKEKAEVYIGEDKGTPIGFALFFCNFSTFLGKGGLFLEDLFVIPEARGKGFGKEILKRLSKTALERGCGRLEWNCLDWNKPSINFYLSLGAVQLSDWTTYRLTGDMLKKLAVG